jgi:hypothetical protein
MIARARYLSKIVRFITDVKLLNKKLKKLKTMEAELNSKSNQKKNSDRKRKVPPQDYETQGTNLIQKPPKKKTIVEASWIGKTEKGEKFCWMRILCELPLETILLMRSWL